MYHDSKYWQSIDMIPRNRLSVNKNSKMYYCDKALYLCNYLLLKKML